MLRIYVPLKPPQQEGEDPDGPKTNRKIDQHEGLVVRDNLPQDGVGCEEQETAARMRQCRANPKSGNVP